MNQATSSIINFFTKERFTIGASILRVFLGLIILYNYTILYSQRHFLFTNDGYSLFSYNSFSLYSLSDSLIYFDIIYYISIVIAILYTLGIKGRISSILNFIFYYSLYLRFGHIGDGGDNLMIITLFFLIFADCTKYFSFEKRKKTRKERPSIYSNLSLITHNFAVFFIIAQVIVLYITSATYQLMGEYWASGTALYYISQVNTMSSSFFENFAANNFVYVGVFLTYSSIFIKYAFVFLIFNKKTKLPIVISMCLFHIGIAISMNLYTFSMIMIAVEVLLFTNAEYYSLYRNYKKVSNSVKDKFLNITNRFSKKYLQNQRIMIFYDGWCGLCLSAVSKLKRLDWFNLLIFIDFRVENNINNLKVDSQALEKRMHSLNIQHNILRNGIDSFTEISKRLISLWIFIPFLYLSQWIGIGNIIYDYIANRRNLIPTHKCQNSTCMINNVKEDAK